MPYLKVKEKNDSELNIYYEDLGSGPAIIFISGWPLTHQMWEYQVTPLREKGFRCITYDRRGFGKSDASLNAYDYDALAADLNELIQQLNIEKVTLVGFSMGGGEVIRYLTKYGSSRIKKMVLIGSVVPYLLHASDNPDGVHKEQFEEMEKGIRNDTPDFFTTFAKQFFGVNMISHPVSQPVLEWTRSMALESSQKAIIDCMKAFSQTDFRDEIASVNVPALIIHGDKDKTVPMEVTSQRAASMIHNATFTVYNGAPHGLFITDKEKLNDDLADFVR